MTTDLSEFKDLFLSEAEDLLQKLNDNLLLLEKSSGDKELLDELMRSAHTMKGSAKTMSFEKFGHLMHLLEDIFDSARDGKLMISKEMINEIFKAFDSIKECLVSIKDSDKESDLDEISQKIEALVGGDLDSKKVDVEKKPDAGLEKKFDGVFDTEIKTASLEEESEKSEESKKLAEKGLAKAVVGEKNEEVSYVKVPVKRLDELMAVTEELLVNKMQIESLVEIVNEKAARLINGECREVTKIKASVESLDKLVSSLQYYVMEARLVPLQQIFARFPRMIRDLSQKQEKEVEVVILGGDLELDRTIVDKLGEPIVHLLRNAVDHGIVGKGTITLKAAREKDFALITVEDDGQGINWAQVVDSSLEKKIITAEEAEVYKNDLTSEKVKDLIYNPILSTNKEITETSGRGVGMSAVKEFMEEVGGSVFVKSPVSDLGGTRFSLEMPLTLAISKVLLLKVRESTFAIPFSNIEKTVKVELKDIKRMADQDVAIINGKDVPLVQLDKAFHYEILKKIESEIKYEDESEIQLEMDDKVEEDEASIDEVVDKVVDKVGDEVGDDSAKTVVLVQRGERLAGLVVDEFLSEQEVTIKPLPSVLKGVKGFSGSTILGNGETILIVDVLSLFDSLKGN